MRKLNYLLDTHTLLWATSAPEKLSALVQSVIENERHRLFISKATLWELSIKENIGKLSLPRGFFERIFDLGYEPLGIELEHLDSYRALPLIHRDPFDRLLIAQALSEKLCLLSCNAQIQLYDVEYLW